MVDYDLFKDIENYATRHAESSSEYYKSRNQSTDKLFKQCLNGKIAEWCNFFSLKEAGYILANEPDMKIYSQDKKSYDADLICIGKNQELYDYPKHIHVKSISLDTSSKMGMSFLVQKNDSLVTNPQEHHYYSVMHQISLTSYKFYKWLDCRYVKYSDPLASHLKATKLAVYL